MLQGRLSPNLSHGQIAVFDGSLENPFNEWTDRHFAQGFTWRPGSVSFATGDEGGRHDVVIRYGCDEDTFADAERDIEVPFVVPASGRIEIASIVQSTAVDLSPGSYQLRFQNVRSTEAEAPKICLSFSTASEPIFRVIKIGTNSMGDHDLLCTASPAC